MGLFRLGVWLHPTEMQALVEALDEDGGGSIDLDEFQLFWDETALERDSETVCSSPNPEPTPHILRSASQTLPRTPSTLSSVHQT